MKFSFFKKFKSHSFGLSQIICNSVFVIIVFGSVGITTSRIDPALLKKSLSLVFPRRLIFPTNGNSSIVIPFFSIFIFSKTVFLDNVMPRVFHFLDQ